MRITFKTKWPVEQTTIFERVYEPQLRLRLADKRKILRSAICVWMFVDGELAGECYGLSPYHIEWDIADLKQSRPGDIYCFSTTILPKFQGSGLGKILVAYWNALASALYTRVIGHVTSDAMCAIRKLYGARFTATHKHWYGTKRVARFYQQPLG